jgi:signal transduction histidine kinase
LHMLFNFPRLRRFFKNYCWCLLFISPCFAQTTKVTQLQQELKKPQADTTRLRLLQQLTEAYSSVDPKKKFYYANVYKQLAEKLHDEHAVADAYINMGISYGIQSKLDSALYYFFLAHDKAVKSNYPLGIARSLADLGFAYDRLDNKQESIKYYFQALPIYKKINYERGVNQCYINIGSIYHDLGKYRLAISYYEQCLKSYIKEKDVVGIAYANYTLGNCYQELYEDDKALGYLAKSLVTRDSIGDLNGSGLVRRAMGIAYMHQKKYDLAIQNLEIALKNMRTLNDKYQEAAVVNSLADVYLKMQKYGMAEDYALQGLRIAKEIKSKIVASTSLDRLVSVYKNTNQINKAFEYQSRFLAVKDSIAAEKAIKDITLTEFDRIRSENAALAKNNEDISTKNTGYLTRLNNYGNVVIIIMGVLLTVVLLVFVLHRRNLKKQAVNKLLIKQKDEIASMNENLQTLNKEVSTQMEISQGQNIELEKINDIKNRFFSIISHDLRGPMGTLLSLFNVYRNGDIGEDDMRMLLLKLEDNIVTTSAFLDNLLEWSKSQFEGVVINPTNFSVNECIAENIKLHKTKTALKDIRVIFKPARKVSANADQNMINLVIRNLLSNSLKFCRPGDSITFDIQEISDRVVIFIKDTGPGISEANKHRIFSLEHAMSSGTQGEKGNFLGLILCRDMVVQNNGEIGFESEPGQGATFWISIPAA